MLCGIYITKTDKAYRLVGDAHVHDVMREEAVSILDKDSCVRSYSICTSAIIIMQVCLLF